MKEPYVEGIANHHDPESCVGRPRGGSEALTGAHAGQVLSHEMGFNEVADLVPNRGRQYGDGRQSQAHQRTSGVKDPAHAWKLHGRELGDLVEFPTPETAAGTTGERPQPHDPGRETHKKSDVGVVPRKTANTTAQAGRSRWREGPTAKGNTREESERDTQRPTNPVNGIQRVREAASRDPNLRLNNLMHHITVDVLMSSYRELNPKAAVGVDHVTWQDYGKGLKERIEDLHERVRSGRYRAQPSRRIYIPKADGKRRPIGIAALEDKIVQHAAVTVLNAIYEVDFEGFSYGFRPGRSQHQALDALHVALSERKVSWVLDADIRGFFDNLNHEWLKRFVEHRVADPGMLRLIAKWLKAGVSEDGEWSAVEVGTPQGAVISPLLANIYLHYSLDLWVNHWRKTQARGEVYFIRYADDFVAGFQYRDDAVKFQDALKQRLAKFDLEIHPDKTRLIEFGRFAEENRKRRGEGKPETFDFLGFTHICSRTRKNGRFQVKRKTIDKKLRSKIKEIRQILKRRRHQSVAVLGAWLASVTRGWYQYYAVPTNYDSLESFRWEIAKAWYDALRRRSQKARRLRWDKMKELVDRWLPQPRILHPWPYQRFNERLASRPKAGAV